MRVGAAIWRGELADPLRLDLEQPLDRPQPLLDAFV